MSFNKFSITIPCRNEEKYIALCLDSIVQCNYPKDLLNVYVCDGLSTDKTVSIIENYAAKYSFIHYVVNQKQTTQYALNLGLKADDADVKIILGAHAEIHPEYLNECLNAFEINGEIGCVGGVLENVIEDETTAVISKAMSSSFGVGNAHFRTGNKDGYVDTVAFGAYRKQVFEKVGYFDEDLTRNQDDEFNFRVIKSGFKIYLSQKIKAKYYVRASYKKLFKQYFQYGYWKVYVNIKHQAVTSVRQLIPFFFVCYLLSIPLVYLLSLKLGVIYSLFLVLYKLLGLMFALKKGSSFIESILILCTFFILHLSYGWGYFKGIFDFVILKNNPAKKHTALSR